MPPQSQNKKTNRKASHGTIAVSRLTVIERRKKQTVIRRRFSEIWSDTVSSLSDEELVQIADKVQQQGYSVDLQKVKEPLMQALLKSPALVEEPLRQPAPLKGSLLRAVDNQLSGLPGQPADQAILLQEVLEASFRQRQSLLADALSAPAVADLLNTSRQTPLNRVEKGTLLAIHEKGKWLFPRWQFDVNGQDGVLSGLPQILQALRVSPMEKISWFVRKSPYLENSTPLEILKSGDVERLVSLARGVGGE